MSGSLHILSPCVACNFFVEPVSERGARLELR